MVHEHPGGRDRRHLRPRPRADGSARSRPSASRRTGSSPISTPAWRGEARPCDPLRGDRRPCALYASGWRAYGVHVFVEKPFAASVADARRDDRGDGSRRASCWRSTGRSPGSPSHVTAKRLIDEGVIGELIEVHFYDGNRGPLYHLADKVEVSPEEVERQKPDVLVVQARRRAAAACSTTSATGRRWAPGTWTARRRSR